MKKQKPTRPSKTIRKIEKVEIYFVPDEDLLGHREEEVLEILFQMLMMSGPSNAQLKIDKE